MSTKALGHPMRDVGARPDIAHNTLVSVVVSTCNRARDLERLFDALNAQLLDARHWELVVVDNRSSDDTAIVISDRGARCRFRVVSTYEERRGKSHGLNTGLALANGAIVTLTDDDAIPAPTWLETIVNAFARSPATACIGGRVELFDSADAPVAVRRARNAAEIGLDSFSPVDIPVIGCNLSVRASALRAAGPFDPDIGPGSRIGVAEDVDMLYRLMKCGHTVRYEPAILVHHNHGRRTREQVDQVLRGYVIGRGALYCKYVLRRDSRMLRWAYWEVVHLAGAVLGGLGFGERSRTATRDLGLLALGAVRYLLDGRAHGIADAAPTRPVTS